MAVKCTDGDRASVKYAARLGLDELKCGLATIEQQMELASAGDRSRAIEAEIATLRQGYDQIQSAAHDLEARVAGRAFTRTTDRLVAILWNIETNAMTSIVAAVRTKAGAH